MGKRPATAVSLERSKEWFDTLPQFVRHITKIRLLHQENLSRFLKIKKYAGHTLSWHRKKGNPLPASTHSNGADSHIGSMPSEQGLSLLLPIRGHSMAYRSLFAATNTPSPSVRKRKNCTGHAADIQRLEDIILSLYLPYIRLRKRSWQVDERIRGSISCRPLPGIRCKISRAMTSRLGWACWLPRGLPQPPVTAS